MSLAIGGDDDLDDDDEADADPFQMAPGQARRGNDDEDDEPTLRFDGSVGGGGQKPPAKSSADLFFGGSMAASTSSTRGTTGAGQLPPHSGVGGGGGPLGSSILAPGLRSPALASPRSSTFAPATTTTHGAASSASRTPSGTSAAPAENRGSYAPDEDDLTDSALESRGLAPEELARVRSLRDERDGLRTMNAVLEDVLGALKLTEGKMEVSSPSPDRAFPPRICPDKLTIPPDGQNFQATIDTSHQLLDLYARIASQAEHTKDLLLDGEWQGVERVRSSFLFLRLASNTELIVGPREQDYEFLAAREQAAREAEEAALREAEEQAAREEAERVRKAQEEQWRRHQAERAAASSSAGAGRGAGRGGVGVRGRGRGREFRISFFAVTLAAGPHHPRSP